MTQVTIYTTSACSYCLMAKNLLNKKGAKFIEIDVSHNAEERHKMSARAGGRRTVPQIFIGKAHVGGCDELHALDARGGLDPLLAAS